MVIICDFFAIFKAFWSLVLLIRKWTKMLWPFVLPNREITALHISLALSLALPLSLPLSAFLPLSLYLCLILSTALSQPHFSTLPRSTSVILLVLSSSLFPPLKLSSSAFLQRNCQPLCKWNIHPALIGLSTCFLFVWPGTGQQSLPPAYQKNDFWSKKKRGEERKGESQAIFMEMIISLASRLIETHVLNT